MTFGQSLVGRSLARTGVLLKRQLWIWPILAVLLLGVIGYTVSSLIRGTMRHNLQSGLTTVLNVQQTMLEKWLRAQEANAQTLANQATVRQLVAKLVEMRDQPPAAGDDPAPTVASPRDADETSAAQIRRQLAQALDHMLAPHGYAGYVVADQNLQIIAAHTPGLIGQRIPDYEKFLSPALTGQTTVSPPFGSVVLLKDRQGRLRTGTPTMFVSAPIIDENLQTIAVLALRIRPEDEFTDILQQGRLGDTGESYAINAQGYMVSNGRFDEELIQLGLLPDIDDARSLLTVQVRDPGGDLTTGFRPELRRRELPLTYPAAQAISGEKGINLDGYRNYRGVPSVGAWTWLPKYNLGLITEVNSAEAYRPLSILNWTFNALYALLAIGAVAIFVFTVIVSRLRKQAQSAAMEAKQLGQYRLLDKLGSGAMGVVYRGQHAMLRRPTAIKMLDVASVTEEAIARFEREVQITCQLNNPHTIAIYDFGRTPEGIFYYAMEFLDGINLQALVDQYGPQPEGRVALILKQVCASLFEAHSQGLVHRDIKPANIMLNRRGGEPDVVKVLDFGLVKTVEEPGAGRGGRGEMSGTPLYMSPEAIQTPAAVDACSDLYAVGAVGYFLLTGQTVFQAKTLGELCQQHLTAVPVSPGARAGRAISHELEYAILACLEKSRSKRPQTARDLAGLLDRVPAIWTTEDAEAWWSRHDRGQGQSTEGDSSANSVMTEQHPLPKSTPGTPLTATAPTTLGASAATKQNPRPPTSPGQGGAATHPAGLDRTTVFEQEE
ncbi:MAG: serine/threonine protein kinase [Pirellulales bacterium]|nr:serine/threonine protein kinase [Pirellulales bacterium]